MIIDLEVADFLVDMVLKGRIVFGGKFADELPKSGDTQGLLDVFIADKPTSPCNVITEDLALKPFEFIDSRPRSTTPDWGGVSDDWSQDCFVEEKFEFTIKG